MGWRIGRYVVAAAVALTGSAMVAAQPRGGQQPSIRIESLAGRDSFIRYCASCHGEAGIGDGPVAPSLRTRPANLTTLAQRNEGAFPRDRVRDVLTGTGRQPAAHGSADMPIWGALLREFESDARVISPASPPLPGEKLAPLTSSKRHRLVMFMN